MIRSDILVPLLNANEPEAWLASIHVRDGQAVEKGALLFTIETTKAASDIESPEAGFIRILANEGDVMAVGQRLAVITDTADEPLEARQAEAMKSSMGKIRFTQPAKALAELLGVSLVDLPSERLVTEDIVRQIASSASGEKIELPLAAKPYILVYGAGGHAKSVMEIILQNKGHVIAGIIDDNPALAGMEILGERVLGGQSRLIKLAEAGVELAANGVGGILDIGVRVRVCRILEKAGFALPVLVHPRATVEPSARLTEGVQVFANAYVGAEAMLGNHCMINTSAVVSHDCVIGEYAHIAPGALLAGHIHVGERTLVGMGVTTAVGIKIGAGARIGNSAKLLADVPDKMIIQVGKIWTGKTV